ncbi:MAG: tetratricopeptide repeat-containing glycosyltransferase family protein [Acidiferrobacterales bacterium]|nr:tetratricopeptide repeat-containing glycosyltransferase family protein [Acidiferrobacterales bacterium]
MSALEQALEHHKAGRLQQAEALYRDILLRDPDQADAWYLLGRIAHEIGQYQNAIALIECAVERKPGVATYRHALGEAFTAMGEHDRAIRAYEEACSRDPQNADAHISRGITLHALGRLDEAIDAFRTATTAQTDYAAAHFNLGNALHEAGRIEEAITAYTKAVELAPDDAEMRNNLGIALIDANRVEEALAAFDQALTLQPEFAGAHMNKGMALLVTGQFTEGWKEYRWRFSAMNPRRSKEVGALPLWDGSNFSGKTLLIEAEQGIGDAIQFIRFLPMLQVLGGRVVLACHSTLRPLLADCPGADEVIDDAPSTISRVRPDLRVSLLDLAGLLGTRVDNIPNQVPYIRADPAPAEDWRKRITQQGFQVGLCWAGLPEHRNDRNRSMPLSAFAPLTRIADVSFYSLQKGVAAAQAQQPPAGMPLIDVSTQLNDFADTAALIGNLDLVISVDTAVAHLAGALARPVWTLLPYAPDWRWLLGRDDTPWYPTMRLFRQPRIGDWDTVMEQVATSLEDLVR